VVRSHRLRFFSHLACTAPAEDHHCIIAPALCPPADWRRRAGRPRTTWLRTVDEDIQPQNFGVYTAWRKDKDRDIWRQVISTAMLWQEFAKKNPSAGKINPVCLFYLPLSNELTFLRICWNPEIKHHSMKLKTWMTVVDWHNGKNANGIIFDGTEQHWPSIEQTAVGGARVKAWRRGLCPLAFSHFGHLIRCWCFFTYLINYLCTHCLMQLVR